MKKKKLNKHRNIWFNKPILKEIYTGWYTMIDKDLIPGNILEIGSGTGNYKDFKPEIISSDVEKKPWNDMVIDAHKMPFDSSSISNIVLIDTFHHLANPLKFLNESIRVLRKGGRVILLEPFPSHFSLIMYRMFHPEPFNFDVDYFNFKKLYKKDPWESNQAVAYLLFYKFLNKFRYFYKGKLKIEKRTYLSFLTYPLSGGFEGKQYYPNIFKKFIDILEIPFMILAKYFAFRCYIVLSKE